MFLIDSHCHLNLLDYKSVHNSISDVLNKAKKRGVQWFLSVSTTLLDYDYYMKYIECRDDVFFSCGLHPTYANQKKHFDYQKLRALSLKKNVVAIGETGLDYYHISRQYSQNEQKDVFRKHINIATEIDKPIIVHSRNAFKDTIKILSEEQSKTCKGVIHCFNEDIEAARLLLNLNFYISFSGIVTFRNSHVLKEVIRYVPIDRILLETDSPYLTPVPYRGRENQPAYIYEIAKYVASIKKVDILNLASITTNNFCNLFHLKDQYNMYINGYVI